MSRLPFRPRAFDRGIRRAIGLSQISLWVEALARALWPALSVGCVLAALALSGLVQQAGPLAHRSLLVLGAAALIWALWYGFRGFRLPSRRGAIARLDAATPVRPLATMTDQLVAGADQPMARALWLEHQRRAAAAAASLRAAMPDMRLAARDRWALRLFAPALLLGSVIAAGDRAADRLFAAVDPGHVTPALPGYAVADPLVEGWAVPPAYTGAETVYLRTAGGGEPLVLPQGTEVTIRASGMEAAPALRAPGLEGPTAFADLGGGLHEAKGRLVASGTLALGPVGAPDAAWPITMTPDRAPTIESTPEPGQTATRALEIGFAASDDYGVLAAWAEIVLADPAEERMEVEPIEFALPLPISGDPRAVSDVAIRDLTEHPWAGAEVLLTLHAEDAAGQISSTEPIALRLPERRFANPLARALVEQRRDLILDYAMAERVLDVIQSVIRFPGEVFGRHTGAYLGVRMALGRLAPAIVEERVADVAPDVAEFLWRAALTLESGDMASALEKLRQAEERLRQALESGTDEEIREAIEDLRQAMNEYLQELARQMMENPEAFSQQQPNPDAQQLSQQDLEALLDMLQQQAESGLRDQARDMLSQLSRMLENLQMGQMQQGQSQGQQALQQLQDMIRRQQELSDRTFDALRQQRRDGQQPGQQGQQGQRGQQGQQGQQPGQQGQPGEGGMRSGTHSENGRLSAEQDALRRAIEELANQLGGGEGMDGASRALGEAGEAMGDARDDLDSGSTGDAIQDQMDALDRLAEGAEALAEAVENGQGQTAAEGRRDGQGRARDRREVDPFERPAGTYGSIDGSSTDVPDQALIERARELMEELRRRSADRMRPEVELDYLRRLLERF